MKQASSSLFIIHGPGMPASQTTTYDTNDHRNNPCVVVSTSTFLRQQRKEPCDSKYVPSVYSDSISNGKDHPPPTSSPHMMSPCHHPQPSLPSLVSIRFLPPLIIMRGLIGCRSFVVRGAWKAGTNYTTQHGNQSVADVLLPTIVVMDVILHTVIL